MAKSAIATGIEIMLNEVGVKSENSDRVFLAGAFGNYLNTKNAMNIGILPQVPIEKIESVGNSSGQGAIECITHPTYWDMAHKVASSAIHIELATHKDFPLRFVKNLGSVTTNG